MRWVSSEASGTARSCFALTASCFFYRVGGHADDRGSCSLEGLLQAEKSFDSTVQPGYRSLEEQEQLLSTKIGKRHRAAVVAGKGEIRRFDPSAQFAWCHVPSFRRFPRVNVMWDYRRWGAPA